MSSDAFFMLFFKHTSDAEIHAVIGLRQRLKSLLSFCHAWICGLHTNLMQNKHIMLFMLPYLSCCHWVLLQELLGQQPPHPGRSCHRQAAAHHPGRPALKKSNNLPWCCTFHSSSLGSAHWSLQFWFTSLKKTLICWVTTEKVDTFNCLSLCQKIE